MIRFWSSSKNTPSKRGPDLARQKLRIGLLVFFVVLTIPFCILLLYTYSQLRTQVFFRHRQSAEEISSRINMRLYELLDPEEKRSFDEYSFIRISESKLTAQKGFSYSPLSDFPPQSSVPGIIGYFQINPDGTFHSPVIPETEEVISSEDELKKRRNLFEELKRLVSKVSLVRERSRNEENNFNFRPDSMADSRVTANKQKEAALNLPQASSPVTLGQSNLYFGKQRENRQAKLNYIPPQEFKSEMERDQLKDSTMKEGQMVAGALMAMDQIQVDSEVVPTKKSVTPQVFNLQGEIEPFDAALGNSDSIIFFRKVWTSKDRFVQGFVVKREEFLKNLVEPVFYSSAISNLALLSVFYQNQTLLTTHASRISLLKSVPLYSISLPPPLNDLDLKYDLFGMQYGFEYVSIVGLFLGYLLTLGIGLYLILRFGLRHIQLAEQQTNFVSAVSHELKTPLTSLRMYGEMLSEGWVKEEAKKKEYYNFIFQESERLSRLVNNVLLFAKLEKQRNPLSPSSHLPDDLINKVLAKVDGQVKLCGFETEVVRDEAENKVMVDEDGFLSIMLNLVDNALKFSKTSLQKKIIIGYKIFGDGPDAEVIFFVRDFGPGIEPGQRKKIFRLFFRGENELTRTTSGTGIGLALAKELAEHMGARLDFVSREVGVEFQLRCECPL